MAATGTDYRDSTKRMMLRSWFDDLPHTHFRTRTSRWITPSNKARFFAIR